MGDPGSELCLSDLKYLSSVVTHTSTVWSSHLARVFFKLRREKKWISLSYTVQNRSVFHPDINTLAAKF